jgi:large subunit ribosomal protein L25
MIDNKIVLVVSKREAVGKKVAKLREDEILPAVVYGKDFASTNIQAPYADILKVVKTAGTHSLVELDIDGEKQTAIIKKIDIDPVKNRLSHIDFQVVSADQTVTTEVPVIIIGAEESEAQKTGMEINQVISELEVKAKPSDLPDKLEVSAVNLKIHGDKLTLAEIKLPNGVELTEEDNNLAIAIVEDPAIALARAEAAEKAAEEAEKATAPSETTEEGEDASTETKDEATEGGESTEEPKSE